MTEKQNKPHDTPEAQLRRRAARIAAGKCLECQEPAIPGRTQCGFHQDKRRQKESSFPSHSPERQAANRAKKRAEGICYQCAEPVVPGRSRCAKHLKRTDAQKAREFLYRRAYYATHRQDIIAKNGAYRREHPEPSRAAAQQRRARKKGASRSDFTAAQWKAMQEAFNHRCAYCNRRCKGKLTQDHITPLAKGGEHTASNIVPACRSCNLRKMTGPVLSPVQPLLIV